MRTGAGVVFRQYFGATTILKWTLHESVNAAISCLGLDLTLYCVAH